MGAGDGSRFGDVGAPLRVLIANERGDRVEEVGRAVLALGHDVIARETDISEVGGITRAERPDVALVGVGEDSERALDMITRIVREVTCPVIALLEVENPTFINEAAKRGIFAYIADGEADQLQSALDIVLRRFGEYQSLEGAFGRRATIERAKGILMAVHGVDEQRAFELLRQHSQRTGRKLVDLAESIADSYLLLAPQPIPQLRIIGSGLALAPPES